MANLRSSARRALQQWHSHPRSDMCHSVPGYLHGLLPWTRTSPSSMSTGQTAPDTGLQYPRAQWPPTVATASAKRQANPRHMRACPGTAVRHSGRLPFPKVEAEDSGLPPAPAFIIDLAVWMLKAGISGAKPGRHMQVSPRAASPLFQITPCRHDGQDRDIDAQPVRV